MHTGRIVFSQLMDFLPKKQFDKCARRYRGDYRTKTFSCFDQYLCMAFAQITFRQSLRDIETCLRAMQPKLYHCGIRGNVSRNTLANANEHRSWRIYADFAQVLIDKARKLYANEDFGTQLKHTAYALDSTTIDLCLALFPWAKFREHKAAVKVHTLMDLRGSIPSFICITDGKVHDVNILDELLLETGAIYIMDRGYLDFARLYTFTQNLSTFITRAKSNLDYQRLLRIAGLSCCASANQLLRHRGKQKIRISNQQLCTAGSDNCQTLQVPLADRNLFQMDQAIPANQNIFRHHQERSEDSNLDCYQRLCLDGYSQEGTQNRVEFERNRANSQHYAFRASAYGTSTYEQCVAKCNLPIS
jgi:hypothetical protein